MVDLAGRYAEALLKAAVRESALPVVTEEIQVLAHVFSQRSEAFCSPLFSVREQLVTVEHVLGDDFCPLIKRFACLLATMRRLGGIRRISDAFVRLAHKEMNLIDLYITVYEEPTPDMAEKLIQACYDKGLLGRHKVETQTNTKVTPVSSSASSSAVRHAVNPHISVDKSLLGGFIAEYEGICWDCSLRTRFVDMSKVIRC